MTGFDPMQLETIGTAMMSEKPRAARAASRVHAVNPRNRSPQVGVLLYAMTPHALAPCLAIIAARLFPTVSDSPAIALSILHSTF